MFPLLDILLEYWIEHVTIGFLYVIFTFPTGIFYRGVPGFATGCPCDVGCRGITTCLLCWSIFWKSSLKWWSVCKFVIKENNFFHCFTSLCLAVRYYFTFVYMIFMSQIMLYFLYSTSVLIFYIDVVLTLSNKRAFFGTKIKPIHSYIRIVDQPYRENKQRISWF